MKRAAGRRVIPYIRARGRARKSTEARDERGVAALPGSTRVGGVSTVVAALSESLVSPVVRSTTVAVFVRVVPTASVTGWA